MCLYSEGVAKSCDSDVNTKFSIDPFADDADGDGVDDPDAQGKYAEIEFTFSSAATVRTT